MTESGSKPRSSSREQISPGVGLRNRLPKTLQAKLGEHLSEIVEGAGVALVVRGLGSLLSFAFHLLLAHHLGSRGTGLFFLAMASLLAFGLLGRIGLDVAFLRFTAAGTAVQDHSGVAATYRRTMLLGIVSASAASISLFLLAKPIAVWVFSEPELAPLLRWAALALLPGCLLRIHAEGLRGLRRIFYYQTLVGVAIPLISIPVFLATEPLGGVSASIWARISALFLTSVLGAFLWHRYAPQKQSGDRGCGIPYRQILSRSFPLAGQSIALFVSNRIPLVILGIWWTAQDAGILGIAMQIAALLSMGLGAANSIIAPKFAALYHQGRHRELDETARQSTWMLLLLALPVLVVLIVFPNSVLALFGRDFAGHGAVLAVLAVGELVNVATGPAGYLLMMTGFERDSSRVAMGTAILSALLAFLVIPRAGVLGAAYVSAAVVAVRNLTFTLVVRRRLGITMLAPPIRAIRSGADDDPMR